MNTETVAAWRPAVNDPVEVMVVDGRGFSEWVAGVVCYVTDQGYYLVHVYGSPRGALNHFLRNEVRPRSQ